MDRGAWQIQYVESQRVRHDKVTEHYEDDICHCVVSYISYEFFVPVQEACVLLLSLS